VEEGIGSGRSENGPLLWRLPGFVFIVLVIVFVVVLDLSECWQPGIDYEDENEDEDDGRGADGAITGGQTRAFSRA